MASNARSLLPKLTTQGVEEWDKLITSLKTRSAKELPVVLRLLSVAALAPVDDIDVAVDALREMEALRIGESDEESSESEVEEISPAVRVTFSRPVRSEKVTFSRPELPLQPEKVTFSAEKVQVATPTPAAVVCITALLPTGTAQFNEYKRVCQGKSREESIEFILAVLQEGLNVTFANEPLRVETYALDAVWISDAQFDTKGILDLLSMGKAFFFASAHPEVKFVFTRSNANARGFGRIRTVHTHETNLNLKVTLFKKTGSRFDDASQLTLTLTL